MASESKYTELNAAIGGIIARGEFASTGDEELDALARVAAGLRGLPNGAFRARLRSNLLSRSDGDALSAPLGWVRNLPGVSWFRGQRAFLAGGSSCGLVAGACCLSGATVHLLGLSSAAAVTSFIHGTIPYFIALSIVSMLLWLGWLLRKQGITPTTLGQTVRQHGVALAGSYGAVFGATMSLSMLMGLY